MGAGAAPQHAASPWTPRQRPQHRLRLGRRGRARSGRLRLGAGAARPQHAASPSRPRPRPQQPASPWTPRPRRATARSRRVAAGGGRGRARSSAASRLEVAWPRPRQPASPWTPRPRPQQPASPWTPRPRPQQRLRLGRPGAAVGAAAEAANRPGRCVGGARSAWLCLAGRGGLERGRRRRLGAERLERRDGDGRLREQRARQVPDAPGLVASSLGAVYSGPGAACPSSRRLLRDHQRRAIARRRCCRGDPVVEMEEPPGTVVPGFPRPVRIGEQAVHRPQAGVAVRFEHRITALPQRLRHRPRLHPDGRSRRGRSTCSATEARRALTGPDVRQTRGSERAQSPQYVAPVGRARAVAILQAGRGTVTPNRLSQCSTHPHFRIPGALARAGLRAIGLGVVTGVFLSLTTAAQSATPPVNLSRPVITGTVELGETLYASPGRWRQPCTSSVHLPLVALPDGQPVRPDTRLARPHLPDHGRGHRPGSPRSRHRP